MEQELLQMIGRLYVEATRYRNALDQLQETLRVRETELHQLKSQQVVVPPTGPNPTDGLST